MRTQPKDTLMIHVDGKQGDVLVTVLNPVMGYGSSIIFPYPVIICSDPQILVMVLGDRQILI